MKVLMIADSVKGNGIGITVFRLYKSLVNRGVQCDIICYQDLKKCPDIVEQVHADNNKIFSIPSISKGPIKYIKNIRKICRKNKYDVVHIHTSLMIFLAAYAAKKEKIPNRIGHAHGAKFFNYPKLIVKLLEPIGRVLNRKYCTNFVTCSQVSAQYTFGKDAILIPNYTPVLDILEISKETIQKCKDSIVNDNTVVFGYMGALDGLKNVIYLPEVILELNKLGLNSELVIVGDGNSKEQIAQKCIALQCENKIHLLGQRDDCSVIVQIFDYYISASVTEGMSLSMLEAQMSGKPCIVSDLIPDYSNLQIGLFKKIKGFEPGEWAANIIKWRKEGFISIDRNQAVEMIEKNGFGEHVVIDRLLLVYKNNNE